MVNSAFAAILFLFSLLFFCQNNVEGGITNEALWHQQWGKWVMTYVWAELGANAWLQTT